jgi:predicted branched-subunit amino acid permease
VPTNPESAALLRLIDRDAISIGLATGTYGISFGAISVTAGFSLWQTQALSLLLFSGASQFAFVSVLATGGSLLAATATAGLLGIRNGLYGMRIAQLVKPRGIQIPLFAQLTIDESTAMANRFDQSEETAKRAFLATGISVFVFWNIATLIGALLAQSVSSPEIYGLDAAIGAGFFALVAPRLKDRTSKLVAGFAVLIALGLTPWLAAGLPILLAATAAVIAAAWSNS